MRVLLTGATGFIGRHVASALAKHEIETMAVVRSQPEARPSLPSRIRILEASVESLHERVAVLREFRPDVCLHLAWFVDPARYMEAPENVAALSASLSLVNLLPEIGCDRFIGVGTCLEYAPSDRPLRETDPCAPSSLYARSKHAMAEVASRLMENRNASFAWARLFYQFGPGEAARRLVPHVIDRLNKGERCLLSTGTQRRDYLFVEDVAEAVLAITRSSMTGPINIGSGTAVSIRELVEEIARQLHGLSLLDFGAIPTDATAADTICADVTKLKSLGWKPRFAFPDGVARSIAAA